MPKKIIHNRAQCKACGSIIESKSRHEMVWCDCGKIAVDGGRDYIKWTGDIDLIIPLQEIEVEDE